jgi:glycogen debranching enzyme
MATTPDEQHADTRHHDGTRRVVQHGRASTTSSIAHAIVVKNDELFFLCEPNGDVPMNRSHGLGLYYRDCRYVDGYELRLGGRPADRLAASAAAGFWATFELTNSDFPSADGQLVEKERIGVTWDRTLDADAHALHDTFAVTNFGLHPILVPLTIRLRSRFDSLFEVRGAQPRRRGTLHEPRWRGATLQMAYDGADGIRRTLEATFDPAPRTSQETTASFDIPLGSQQQQVVRLTLAIHESPSDQRTHVGDAARADIAGARRAVRHSSDKWVAAATRVASDSRLLGRVVDKSLRDLHLLRTTLQDRQYFAAGVPWYVTLFGRDSIITAIEALAFMPDRAADTVRLLARYQGTHEDAWRDEAPGKIMHELRFGEMARLGEIPQTPYYGSVDATPLFLVLIAEHAAWTGSLDLFTEMKSHVEAALNWIDRSMARGGTGYLAYATRSSNGLANQGWKDSGDSISNHDGSLADPPIALVEVQGYVYRAKRGIGGLYRRAGDNGTADRLLNEAEDLRQRFERDFWIDDLGTYALALQKENRPAAVISSNPGQALWAGIASPERAASTAERLMQEDMFCGWGIRTLSSRERRYNPIGYHNGTVWPHDNAIALAGFRRYGHVEPALKVMSGIIDAATHFEHDRLPEVFSGFSRSEFAVPVHYPVACHPQAWAAGAIPFMLQSALGLVPDAFERTLHVVSPVLPDYVQTLSLDGLRVGGATVRLVFARERDRQITLQDVRVDGDLAVKAE